MLPFPLIFFVFHVDLPFCSHICWNSYLFQLYELALIGNNLYLPGGVRELAEWGVVRPTLGRVWQRSLHARLSAKLRAGVCVLLLQSPRSGVRGTGARGLAGCCVRIYGMGRAATELSSGVCTCTVAAAPDLGQVQDCGLGKAWSWGAATKLLLGSGWACSSVSLSRDPPQWRLSSHQWQKLLEQTTGPGTDEHCGTLSCENCRVSVAVSCHQGHWKPAWHLMHGWYWQSPHLFFAPKNQIPGTENSRNLSYADVSRDLCLQLFFPHCVAAGPYCTLESFQGYFHWWIAVSLLGLEGEQRLICPSPSSFWHLSRKPLLFLLCWDLLS